MEDRAWSTILSGDPAPLPPHVLTTLPTETARVMEEAIRRRETGAEVPHDPLRWLAWRRWPDAMKRKKTFEELHTVFLPHLDRDHMDRLLDEWRTLRGETPEGDPLERVDETDLHDAATRLAGLPPEADPTPGQAARLARFETALRDRVLRVQRREERVVSFEEMRMLGRERIAVSGAFGQSAPPTLVLASGPTGPDEGSAATGPSQPSQPDRSHALGVTGEDPPAAATEATDDEAPVVNMEEDRIESILNDTPAHFEFTPDPSADSSPPFWESPERGRKAVQEHNEIIETMASRHGVDADLIRAIMYFENARGNVLGFGDLADDLKISDTKMPMNINPDIWGQLMGETADQLENPEKNIEAAAILISRISDRLTNPTAEAVGSIWNFTGREKTSDKGAYIARIYDEKPWIDESK